MNEVFQKTKGQKSNVMRRKLTSALILLLIAAVSADVYLRISDKSKTSNFFSAENDYPFLNPARYLYKPENLIVNLQPLRDDLNDKYEADGDVSIYFEYLPTGANIAISKDAEFYPASLLKVPVAMAVAKKIEKGDWKWTNELVLMSADKDDEFGSLYKQASGSTFTIEELVRRSLSDSDNTAHFILVRNLETEEISDVYDHMGLIGFLNTDGKISAKRYSIIFRSLYNSSYLTEKNSQKLLSFLSQSPFREYIQSALPDDLGFAHKIGISVDKKVYSDSGIVYQKDRPYLLTIMARKNEQTAKGLIKAISGKVYNYVRDYKE